ncbi:MAG: hypothetical protein ACI9W4_000869 [Rhodothermales bacterium]|jgi:hypothetical protein
MKKWLGRLRGAIGMGLFWATAPGHHSWHQRDRLDAADNYPGIVDQESPAQAAPRGGLSVLGHADIAITQRYLKGFDAVAVDAGNDKLFG